MKKTGKILLTGLLAACTAFSLAACGGTGDMLSEGANQGIEQGVSESVHDYDSVAMYSMTDKEDVKIHLETDEIQKVSFMFRVLDKGDYSFRNDTLTVKSEVFENQSAGDKKLRVFVDNMYFDITVRLVSKVIYTVEDFNAIRYDLNGTYALGADLDFENQAFWPIGKAYEAESDGSYSTGVFEGVFDGNGHTISNITINALDYAEGEDGNGQGPSLGGVQGNSQNYNNGIFMQTSANAQIINTNFNNITVNCQGLGGAVVGMNGGLVKNCFVTCSLYAVGDNGGGAEHVAGIAGVNGSTDAPGRIENCLVVYRNNGSGNSPRGIADWNNGSITNCYAAAVDSYVFHPGYDSTTGKIDPDFDINTYFNETNFSEALWGYYTLVALPGSMDTSIWAFYPAGEGKITNSEIVRKEFMLDPDNFSEADGWDRSVWTFSEGSFPKLIIQN